MTPYGPEIFFRMKILWIVQKVNFRKWIIQKVNFTDINF